MSNQPKAVMAEVRAQLDHVVLLLPYSYLAKPPAWLTDNFTIGSGGRHADGKTENRLIIFEDGSYLELIAFVDDDPAKRRGHWWDKPFGVIDFALRGSSSREDVDFSAINARLSKTNTGISYDTPQPGGRTTPDGVELKWVVSFPKGAERGSVPFWCQDRTPRERRVPVTETNTRHPSGAVGIKAIQLEVDSSTSFARLNRATSAIVDRPITENGEYAVGRPFEIGAGAAEPVIRIGMSEEEGDGGKAVLRLALVLHAGQEPPEDIRQEVENNNGLVAIQFDRS